MKRRLLAHTISKNLTPLLGSHFWDQTEVQLQSCWVNLFLPHKPTPTATSNNSLVATPISKSKTANSRESFGQNDKKLPLLVTPDRNSKFLALQLSALPMLYSASAATNAVIGGSSPSIDGFLGCAKSPKFIPEIRFLRKHRLACKRTNSTQFSSLSISVFLTLSWVHQTKAQAL